MYVFADNTGKRTEASEENAREMIKDGGGFSALWPRGTPEEEAFEFAALCKDTTEADAIARAQQPRQTVAVEAEYTPRHRSSFTREQE